MSAPTALYTVGGGEVMPRGDGVRLTLPSLDGRRYADAQVDDYRGEGELRWRPPLRLTLRARFSHDAANLRGTAGFGFWNDPFGMTGRWRLRLPQTVWFFFAAPPSDLRLTTHAPGYGWKAATLDAGRWQARLLVPLAIPTMVAAWWPWLHRRVWPWVARRLAIDEAMISYAMDEWHEYALTWHTHSVHCTVDDVTVLWTAAAPRGPLGLVIWIDNQYMVVTPQGRFGAGTAATGAQWLEIADLQITPL